jgi:hypothetical protein
MNKGILERTKSKRNFFSLERIFLSWREWSENSVILRGKGKYIQASHVVKEKKAYFEKWMGNFKILFQH